MMSKWKWQSMIKNYIDDHPEIHFDTDGDIDQTFTHIGELLNDYLNF